MAVGLEEAKAGWSMMGNGDYFLGLGVLTLHLELMIRAWIGAVHGSSPGHVLGRPGHFEGAGLRAGP